MCGRYVLIDGKKVLATYAVLKNARQVNEPFAMLPRYNAAPMQRMPVVAVRNGELVVEPMQWWLVPHWSKENSLSFATFNAKAETLDQSKLFGPYFKRSRCLVPADAFYEWQKATVSTEVRGKKKTVTEKHPICIRMKDESPLMFAGLFSVWKDPQGKELPTFTIITTRPNELLAPIHNRMPVILAKQHFEQWLDREYQDVGKLKELLAPSPAGALKAYRVSTIVSNSRNDVPECIEPLKK